MRDLEAGQDLGQGSGAEEMPTIDLTLAVNYLPAVEVVLKVALFASTLSLMDQSEIFYGVAVMALMLSVDRSLRCELRSPGSVWILDGNALQFAVLMSWFVNRLRTEASAPGFVLPLAMMAWILASLALVAEPKAVQEFYGLYGGAGGTLRQIGPGVVNSFFVGLSAFLPCEAESGGVRVLRSLGFTLLCVLWVYVVGVWRARPRQHQGGMCMFASHALIARFCPVLYLPWFWALMYGLNGLGAMVYHYVQIHMVTVTVRQTLPTAEVSYCSVGAGVGGMSDGIGTIAEEDDDLEAYFQTAKMQLQRGIE